MSSNPQNTTGLQVLAGSNDLQNIEVELQRQALTSSARLVSDYMRGAAGIVGREAVLDHALSKIKPDGLICEFGVADGHTVNYIADRVPGHPVHGFDSFKGLPERWRDGFDAGFFACGMPNVRENVVLYQGLFADSLPDFIAKNPEPLAFLHVDCDLYSSTKTVLELMREKIVPGTVIVFDEFFNYPFWQHHEARAWWEFAMNGLEYQYLCYNKFGEQIALQLR